jgi:mannitol/fructose-specific phosphotransferase system IIA component (Ntr-type)
MLLSDVVDKRSIILNLASNTKEAVFAELIEAMAAVHPEFDRNKMFSIIQDRENKMNTGIAPGVAVPHGCYPGTNKVIGAIGISKTGINYDALFEEPVRFVFLMLMGETAREKHLGILNRVLSLINSGALAAMENAESAQEVYDLLVRFP